MKIWKTRPVEEAFARQLADELSLPRLLARVLSGYGFSNTASVARFLNPRLMDISDPGLIPRMEAAVIRIWRAIQAKENILIYGDYDVDGIMGSVLMLRVLRRLGAGHVVHGLPDRLNEGYGLNMASLQRCLTLTSPELIITVDCGTTAVESAEYLAKKGIDLIVTDHHEPLSALPPAVAILNPKLGNVESLKILSGVGVAFKLCHAMLKYGKINKYAHADFDLCEYLDLVALGTVADIVPLLDENRIFVRHGLAQLNSSDSIAWKALKEVAALKDCLDTYHLAFCIAPRLNAAGRLDTAETALELFLTEDENRARSIAAKLDAANRERQEIEAKILKEALAEIDGYFKPDIHYGIVVGRRSWHVGVIGIVASRLASRYHRPVIVIGFDKHGSGRGSARSIEGYNILNGLKECEKMLINWGGHEMAAGMELNEKNYPQLKRLFNQAARLELKDKNLAPLQTVNAWIQLSDVSDQNFKELEKLAPFGQGNPKPVFAARGVKITAPPRIVGKKHLRFTVSDGKTSLSAIAFNHAEGVAGHAASAINHAASATSHAASVTSHAGSVINMAGPKIPEGLIDIAFQIRKNLFRASRDTFNDAENLELNILDYRKTSG